MRIRLTQHTGFLTIWLFIFAFECFVLNKKLHRLNEIFWAKGGASVNFNKLTDIHFEYYKSVDGVFDYREIVIDDYSNGNWEKYVDRKPEFSSESEKLERGRSSREPHSWEHECPDELTHAHYAQSHRPNYLPPPSCEEMLRNHRLTVSTKRPTMNLFDGKEIGKAMRGKSHIRNAWSRFSAKWLGYEELPNQTVTTSSWQFNTKIPTIIFAHGYLTVPLWLREAFKNFPHDKYNVILCNWGVGSRLIYHRVRHRVPMVALELAKLIGYIVISLNYDRRLFRLV